MTIIIRRAIQAEANPSSSGAAAAWRCAAEDEMMIISSAHLVTAAGARGLVRTPTHPLAEPSHNAATPYHAPARPSFWHDRERRPDMRFGGERASSSKRCRQPTSKPTMTEREPIRRRANASAH